MEKIGVWIEYYGNNKATAKKVPAPVPIASFDVVALALSWLSVAEGQGRMKEGVEGSLCSLLVSLFPAANVIRPLELLYPNPLHLYLHRSSRILRLWYEYSTTKPELELRKHELNPCGETMCS